MTKKTPPADPVVTPELVKQHGLTPEEFERIKKILGREPNFTELGIFSVMWSEHCSYKNSKKELKKFPTTGPNILVKPAKKMPALLISATVGRSRLRWKATTIRARFSIFRALPLESVESFATFSPWARVRNFASTRCALGRSLKTVYDRVGATLARRNRTTPDCSEPATLHGCGIRYRALRELRGHPDNRWRDLFRRKFRG